MTAAALEPEMKPLATSAELHNEPRALAALHCSRTSSSDERRIASIDSSPLVRSKCACCNGSRGTAGVVMKRPVKRGVITYHASSLSIVFAYRYLLGRRGVASLPLYTNKRIQPLKERKRLHA